MTIGVIRLRASSFISTKFFVLNLVSCFDVLSKKSTVFFYIPLLSYCINVSSSIIPFLFSKDIHISFGISFHISIGFSSVCEEGSGLLQDAILIILLS